LNSILANRLRNLTKIIFIAEIGMKIGTAEMRRRREIQEKRER
jgi:hypothetical protein